MRWTFHNNFNIKPYVAIYHQMSIVHLFPDFIREKEFIRNAYIPEKPEEEYR